METPLQTSPPLFGFIINCYTRRMRQSKGEFNLSFEKKKSRFFTSLGLQQRAVKTI